MRSCPADLEEVVEAYSLGSLDRQAALAFEEHYLACERCASMVADTEDYIRSMKTALQRLRPETRPAGA
jgi:anti-sigma factor RsiW